MPASIGHLIGSNIRFTGIKTVKWYFYSSAADNEWENELQQELKEYEMVDEGGEIIDDDLENEILQEIENETNKL